jgi:hypothetical protein
VMGWGGVEWGGSLGLVEVLRIIALEGHGLDLREGWGGSVRNCSEMFRLGAGNMIQERGTAVGAERERCW